MLPKSISEYVAHAASLGMSRKDAIRQAVRLYRHGELPPNYSLPSCIGRVSLGEDYVGIWFIDDADESDPVMIWCYDTWLQVQVDCTTWKELAKV